MNKSKMYQRYRFLAVIIQYAVWLYQRFNLSHRDIEDIVDVVDNGFLGQVLRQWLTRRFVARVGDRFGMRISVRIRGRRGVDFLTLVEQPQLIR